MDQQRVDFFFAANSNKFHPEQYDLIRNMLEKMDDQRFFRLQTLPLKDPVLMLVLSILGGQLGIDRFILGQTGLGLAKLLTCGGIGIWTIVDWFLIMGLTRDYNFQKFVEIAG